MKRLLSGSTSDSEYKPSTTELSIHLHNHTHAKTERANTFTHLRTGFLAEGSELKPVVVEAPEKERCAGCGEGAAGASHDTGLFLVEEED